MAFPSLGPFGNIVEDFTKSLQNIFGTSTTEASKLTYLKELVVSKGTGHSTFVPENWTGNTNRIGAKLRYGFSVINIDQIGSNGLKTFDGLQNGDLLKTYYLDIPPQAISQKEIFATNITATRRGIVVESEGVVFKDIIISGTTGVFPGKRDGFGGEQVDYKKLTQAPTKAGGVQAEGTSKSSTIVSGYSEFLGLRAYFLKYAQSKIEANGNLFLVFINEKDQQALVVEPLEFTMERNSKNPVQYQYRIVLKCLTTLDAAFSGAEKAKDSVGLINDIVNISRNASAAIQQFRAAVGTTNRLVQSISQEIDKTFINPLRLLGLALKDVAEARHNILATGAALLKNLDDSLLTIAEFRFEENKTSLSDRYLYTRKTGQSVKEVTFVAPTSTVSTGKISERGTTDFVTSKNLLDRSEAENFVNTAILALETSASVPLSKSFVQGLLTKAKALADDIADVVNLGNLDYDTIKDRSPSFIPNPLRSATSNEFILLGTTLKLIASLNHVVATDKLFLIDVQATFQNDKALLKDIADIKAPTTIREIIIMQGDTLERISLREYGTVARWVELAVLNNLKYPYIGDVKVDGVKLVGEKLMVGN